MHPNKPRRLDHLVRASGALLLLGLLLAPLVQGQTPAPVADAPYWQSYAETLAVSRNACEQAQLQLRLQGQGDQKRLAELQQKVQELEAKLKAVPAAEPERKE
jgi:hypothetical protein